MADIRLDHSAIQAMLRSPDVADILMDAARPHVRLAQTLAPKRTGLGAASIHAEPVLDGDQYAVEVSWTQERYYMYFHEVGTRYMPARPFLVPAFEV